MWRTTNRHCLVWAPGCTFELVEGTPPSPSQLQPVPATFTSYEDGVTFIRPKFLSNIMDITSDTSDLATEAKGKLSKDQMEQLEKLKTRFRDQIEFYKTTLTGTKNKLSTNPELLTSSPLACDLNREISHMIKVCTEFRTLQGIEPLTTNGISEVLKQIHTAPHSDRCQKHVILHASLGAYLQLPSSERDFLATAENASQGVKSFFKRFGMPIV